MTPNRRQFLAIAALRSAAPREVRFVRIDLRAPAPHLVKAVQLALGEGPPSSVTIQRGVHTRMMTLRYRSCVVSYEIRPNAANGITFHGDRDTLRIPVGG